MHIESNNPFVLIGNCTCCGNPIFCPGTWTDKEKPPTVHRTCNCVFVTILNENGTQGAPSPESDKALTTLLTEMDKEGILR